MPRYAAFLRGVMPTNAKMPQLKAAFEAAGLAEVKTVLGSGNVVFTAPTSAVATLERRAEKAMHDLLGHAFLTIVRPVSGLRKLLESHPYKGFRLSPGSKRIVTFLRARPSKKLSLPIELDGTRILSMQGGMIFSAYVRNPKGPVFMSIIEKTFGREVTTRTWETIAKCAR